LRYNYAKIKKAILFRYLKDRKSFPVIISTIAIIFLIIGIFPIKEYNFYIALRCVVFLASLFLSFKIKRSSPYYWGFLLIGLLFNPIIPFHINKVAWVFFDSAAAGVFFSFLRNHLRPSKGDPDEEVL